MFEIIKSGEYSFEAKTWEKVSDEGKDFIKGLLVVNPDKRFTSDEILEHPWFMGQFETDEESLDQMLGKMKVLNSNKKGATAGTKEIRK